MIPYAAARILFNLYLRSMIPVQTVASWGWRLEINTKTHELNPIPDLPKLYMARSYGYQIFAAYVLTRNNVSEYMSPGSSGKSSWDSVIGAMRQYWGKLK